MSIADYNITARQASNFKHSWLPSGENDILIVDHLSIFLKPTYLVMQHIDGSPRAEMQKLIADNRVKKVAIASTNIY
jgi:hypothetical protein